MRAAITCFRLAKHTAFSFASDQQQENLLFFTQANNKTQITYFVSY